MSRLLLYDMNINKLFQIRCQRCRWSEFSSGLSKDLTHLTEIKKCQNCGGKRTFKCKKCGGMAPMKRLGRNEDVK